MELKSKEELLQFEQPLEFKDDLENVQLIMPNLDYITESEMQEELAENLLGESKQIEREKFALEIDLFIQLLQKKDEDEVVNFVDEAYTNIAKLKRENQAQILEKIKPYETTVRAANLFFENALETADRAKFIVVDPERFAGKDNQDHFDQMAAYLKDKFYKPRLRNSPLFIGHLGDIGKGAEKMAQIANQTIAMAVVDIPKTKSVKVALQKAASRNLKGTDPEWANLTVCGTWVVARDPVAGVESSGLMVPASGAILGKMMQQKEGTSVAGLTGDGRLKGVTNAAYEGNRLDSPKFEKEGMIMLIPDDNKVYLFGDNTAFLAGNEELRKVPKMIVRNRIMKDLVDFCNLKAFSKWNRQEKDKFLQNVRDYLKDRKDDDWIVSVGKVEAVNKGTNEVALNVQLVFHDTKSKYLISISGKSEDFKVDKAEQI